MHHPRLPPQRGQQRHSKEQQRRRCRECGCPPGGRNQGAPARPPGRLWRYACWCSCHAAGAVRHGVAAGGSRDLGLSTCARVAPGFPAGGNPGAHAVPCLGLLRCFVCTGSCVKQIIIRNVSHSTDSICTSAYVSISDWNTRRETRLNIYKSLYTSAQSEGLDLVFGAA